MKGRSLYDAVDAAADDKEAAALVAAATPEEISNCQQRDLFQELMTSAWAIATVEERKDLFDALGATIVGVDLHPAHRVTCDDPACTMHAALAACLRSNTALFERAALKVGSDSMLLAGTDEERRLATNKGNAAVALVADIRELLRS